MNKNPKEEDGKTILKSMVDSMLHISMPSSPKAHREAEVMDRPKPAGDRGELGVSCWSCFPFC